MSAEKKGANLQQYGSATLQPGPSSSSLKQDSQGKGTENEELSGKGEENGGKGNEEFRSPKTNPMLPPEVRIFNCANVYLLQVYFVLY